MIVSQMNQVFYPQEAVRLFDHCTCRVKGGGCPWCDIYYHGEYEAVFEENERAWIEYAKSLRAEAADAST